MVASHSYEVENETETKTKKKKQTRKRIKKGFKNDEQNSDCHFEIPPETGSVLCRIALWDGLKFCIGFHEVAQNNGSKFVCQNSPIMQFERSPKMANIHVDNLRVLFKQKKLHCVPVSHTSPRVTEATSRGHIACNIAG